MQPVEADVMEHVLYEVDERESPVDGVTNTQEDPPSEDFTNPDVVIEYPLFASMNEPSVASLPPAFMAEKEAPPSTDR